MTVAAGFDKGVNLGLLLALPLQEGIGLVSYDTAKPHHELTLHGPPAWSSIASGLGVLDFNGADYLDCPAAATVDLDFVAGDYSIVLWTYHSFTATSQIIIARYGTDLDGWELYFFDTILELRHHHVSLAPDTRDGCFSSDWNLDTWYLLGISRSGLYPKHYRNGLEVTATYDAGGLKNPDTCNRDLVIGTRYTKNADWYDGMIWNPRVWNRALTPEEMRHIWNRERWRFGV